MNKTIRQFTVKDHERAAFLYNKKAQGEKLTFQEQNTLFIYEKIKEKLKKVSK